jgi:hypothetical protein
MTAAALGAYVVFEDEAGFSMTPSKNSGRCQDASTLLHGSGSGDVRVVTADLATVAWTSAKSRVESGARPTRWMTCGLSKGSRPVEPVD